MRSRREPTSLFGDDVDEPRPLHLANGGERVDERIDVVAVDRTEIPEAELLEEDARGQEVLDALLPLPHERRDPGERRRGIVDHRADCAAQSIIERVALHGDEVLRHRPDVRRDRHLVVVEDHDDVPIRRAGVVQPLVREAAGERPVPKNGDHLERLPEDVAPGGHPVRGGDGRCRMPGPEGVVLALVPLQEAGDAVFLTQRLHLARATRQDLVRVSLVAHVPDDLIARRIEDAVQRDGKLHHPEARTDVTPRARADVDETLADRRRQLT
jgi:hypothetical protein